MEKRSNGIWVYVVAGILVAAYFGWRAYDAPNNERREKFLKCWNSFVDQSNAANTFWNNFVDAKQDPERLVQLRRCREAWDGVSPFDPVGVDPRLADGIATVKKAWLALVDDSIKGVGRSTAEWNRHYVELHSAAQTADDQLNSVFNRVASEVGDIAKGRPR